MGISFFSTTPTTLLVTVSGEVDHWTGPVLARTIARRADTTEAIVIFLDLRHVSFLDAGGIRALSTMRARIGPDRFRIGALSHRLPVAGTRGCFRSLDGTRRPVSPLTHVVATVRSGWAPRSGRAHLGAADLVSHVCTTSEYFLHGTERTGSDASAASSPSSSRRRSTRLAPTLTAAGGTRVQRLEIDRGSPNQGSTLFSKRVMAQIRSPVRVRT